MRLFEALPFPRGQTMGPSSDGYAATVGVVGRLFAVYDKDAKSEILLRVVAAGGNLTLTPGLFVGFDASELLKKTDSIAVHGEIARAIDTEYTGQSVTAGTLFYVIEQGPATVLKATGNGTDVSAKEALYVDKDGKINGTVSSGYVVGYSCATADENADSVSAFLGA